MSLLRKSLDAVAIADLEALVEAGARETGELEFKGSLPFQPQKNQPERADRWIEKGDRVGGITPETSCSPRPCTLLWHQLIKS
jgi:hypothetical protein